MNKLIVANLLHRPMRSLISVLAVALEVIMILSIAAVFNGMLDGQKERSNGIGADLTVRPSNASMFNGTGGATLPVKNAEAIRHLQHVAIVAPVVQQFNTSGHVEILYGIDYPSFNAMKPFTFISGGPFQGPWDVIIDDIFAKSNKGYHVGDTIEVMKHQFRICGIVEHGKGGRKMLPLTTMWQLMPDADGKASLFYVKADKSANANLVSEEIQKTRGFEANEVQTMEEWVSMMTPDKIPGFNIALNVVTGIAVIVGFLVIFQSMYTAVLERTREIGILKSMGASKMAVVSVVVRETALLAVTGVLLGIVGTFGVQSLIGHVFPTLEFEISSGWIVRGAIIAFVGSLFGALYPAWMASRKDPIDALAYE
jgi:putative ABC transport system permease protein